MKRSALLPAIVALVIAAVADAPRLARAANGFDIKVLSNRADLISGGDALVEIVLPAGVDPASVRVDVDGRDVTAAFAVMSPMYRPLGRTAKAAVTSRPSTSTRTLAGSTPAGSTISTRASPPLMTSARFDKTLISNPFAARAKR